MGLLSSTISMSQYTVKGKIEGAVLEKVYDGLVKYAITDDETSEKNVGWTSFETPYAPDFEGSSFVIGSHMIFSLRIDKKTIPSKVLKKHYTISLAKKLAETGRDFLSRNEKKLLKEQVANTLLLRIPSTPNIYDILWNYEESSLWFFTNLKDANEELETIFSKSFKLSVVRMFPYTISEFKAELSNEQKDVLSKLNPCVFTE